jgi:hypothetical protein
MNDYIAGYLGAAGIQAALIRRAKEGGSYHVRVNPMGNWCASPLRCSSPKPSPTGRTRYSWSVGQAKRDGRTADSTALGMSKSLVQMTGVDVFPL